MEMTGVPQIPDLPKFLDSDDFDEPGTVDLHLGVRRRLVRFAISKNPPSTQRASER